MEIELIPNIKKRDIKSRIAGLLKDCISFQASVAFWTINGKFFGPDLLIKALKKDNSFICADIQLPTSIDNLKNFYDKGVQEIYLHKYRQSPTEYTSNTNLLHTKIYLFLMEKDQVVIIIGSHNLTPNAILGSNIEASVMINCTTSDKIYTDTVGYLKSIRDDYCTKFDEEKIEIYKILQTRNAEITNQDYDLKRVVTLTGENMAALQTEEIILLLSLDKSQHAKFKTTGDELYLHTLDVKTKSENLYRCKVLQTGELDKNIAQLEIDFIEPRRFAFIGTKKLFLLHKRTKITKQMLEASEYFVNVSISEQLTNFKVFEKPSGDGFSYWQIAFDSPYHNKVSLKRRDNSAVLFPDNIDHTDGEKLPKYHENIGVQVADFEIKPNLKLIALSKDYFKISEKLSEFYKELTQLIENEANIYEIGKGSLMHTDLHHFLQTVHKDINLPQYAKSLIERIIIDLDKKSK